MPKIENNTFFCTRHVCVIQHRNWPLRSTILKAHGTSASSDGLCTRTHTNEAFSCWFCCKSFRVDRARRGNYVFRGMAGSCVKCLQRTYQVQVPVLYTITFFFCSASEVHAVLFEGDPDIISRVTYHIM